MCGGSPLINCRGDYKGRCFISTLVLPSLNRFLFLTIVLFLVLLKMSGRLHRRGGEICTLVLPSVCRILIGLITLVFFI